MGISSAKILVFFSTKNIFMKDILQKIKDNSNHMVMGLILQKKENTLANLKMVNQKAKENLLNFQIKIKKM